MIVKTSNSGVDVEEANHLSHLNLKNNNEITSTYAMAVYPMSTM